MTERITYRLKDRYGKIPENHDYDRKDYDGYDETEEEEDD